MPAAVRSPISHRKLDKEGAGYNVPEVADVTRRRPGWQRLGCVLVPNGRCSAPRVAARVSSLALFYSYGVLAAEKESDVQEVGSGGRIDERFAAPVAFLRSTPYRQLIGVVRINNGDAKKRWQVGIGAGHVIRDAKGIRRRVEGVRLLVAVALKGVYELGVRTGARGLSSSGSRFAKYLPRQRQNEAARCHECRHCK
jgi:hypothetical protein